MYKEDMAANKSSVSFNTLVALIFVISYGGTIMIFLTINEGEGNGGAFKAAFGIFFLAIGAGFTTVLGLIAAIKGFIQKNQPRSIVDSPWLPLLLASPPIIFYAWQFTIHVLL